MISSIYKIIECFNRNISNLQVYKCYLPSLSAYRDNKVKGVNMSSAQFVLDNLSAFDHCYTSST